MRLVLIMTMSVDGFITRDPDQDTIWDTTQDTFFDPETRRIGTVIMGANTYHLMPEPLADRHTIVMSSVLREAADLPQNVEFFSGEPAQLVKQLEDRGIDEVALIGGAQLNASFLNQNLVDEIYLTIIPQLFGQGISLASGYVLETNLEVLEVRELDGGTVLLHYAVIK